MSDNHFVITPPDRYWSEAINILLVDWPYELIEQCCSTLQSFNNTLAVHVYHSSDNEQQWFLDVAMQADLIVMNMSQPSHIDVLKGYLLPRNKVHYWGRPDLQKTFLNYLIDPTAQLIALVGKECEKKVAANIAT
jgi:hypothetical protein